MFSVVSKELYKKVLRRKCLIMMIRNFLPVGQGAFYCERFKSKDSEEYINIIYDCGSSTDKSLVEQQIKDNFERKETIHALFISHLDDDHVNGIPFLLKYCKVKKIFFPIVTEMNAKYLLLYNLIKNRGNDSFVASFLRNPYNALSEVGIENTPGLYQVRENVQDSNEEVDLYRIDAIPVYSGADIFSRIFEDEYKMSEMYKKWVYIPYNFRRKDRVAQLQKELNILFGKNMNNEDLIEIWKKGGIEREKIRIAYTKVKGSFNTNSMTLYSGPEELIVQQYLYNKKSCKHICKYSCNEKVAGCLYTGDYDASGRIKWRELFNAYFKYWNNIGCVQVPHHGSRKNYNTELSKLDAYFVMSAGRYNRYHHPHSVVVKDLLFNGHYPYIVTENKLSEVKIVVDI